MGFPPVYLDTIAASEQSPLGWPALLCMGPVPERVEPMREYQNADYRSIYTEPIAVPGIGDCWLMVFTEPTNENDSSRPEDETWTALFLVSSCLETADTIKDCLEATVGYKGEPTPEEAAVGLAEFGKRITLWEKVSEEGEADLEVAQREAARLLANPAILSDYAVHKCSACGEQSDTRLDARILHAAGIHPQAEYCRHCGQYPASIMRSKP